MVKLTKSQLPGMSCLWPAFRELLDAFPSNFFCLLLYSFFCAGKFASFSLSMINVDDTWPKKIYSYIN